MDVTGSLTRKREARVSGVVSDERRKHHERDRTHEDDHDLTQTTLDAFGETGGFCTLLSGIGQFGLTRGGPASGVWDSNGIDLHVASCARCP